MHDTADLEARGVPSAFVATVEFEDTPLNIVTDYLAKQAKVNIVIDPMVFEEKSEDELLVTIQVRDIKLADLLELILGLKGLGYYVADGVVNVSAQDLGTGKSQAIRVTASSGLSEDEVDRLVHDAEEHAQSDRERREGIDLRNQADGLIYSTERTLEEFAESVSDEDRAGLETAIAAVQEVMGGADLAALRTAVDELSSRTFQMTEALYAKLGGGQDSGGE